MKHNKVNIPRGLFSAREWMEYLILDFTKATIAGGVVWRPNTDVYETELEFVVRMDIAGMTREEFAIVLDEHYLTIKGVRKDNIPPGKKHFHKMEVSVGPFERNIPIPIDCDPTTVAATYRDGILEVRIKKSGGQEREAFQIRVD